MNLRLQMLNTELPYDATNAAIYLWSQYSEGNDRSVKASLITYWFQRASVSYIVKLCVK